jgi:RNA recognition motif-containing protein
MSVIICRKCGGPHFTIKCGQEVKLESNLISKPESKPEPRHEPRHEQRHEQRHDHRRDENKYSIRIKDLPSDITYEELQDLMAEWGQIYRIKVNNYEDNSTAYVDFKYEVEAEHFIKALDKTIFDNLVITVEKVVS